MLRFISTVAMFSLVYQPVESTTPSHSNTGAVEGVAINSYESPPPILKKPNLNPKHSSK